jgi:hypothetical protein
MRFARQDITGFAGYDSPEDLSESDDEDDNF